MPLCSNTGLTLSPQTNPASPAVKTLRAALISLSWTAPHSGQTHSRTFNGIFGAVCPQPEQRFDGNIPFSCESQQNQPIGCAPYLPALNGGVSRAKLMKKRFTRAFILAAMQGCIALSLTACSVATLPPSEVTRVAPVGNPMEPPATTSASQCSAVDETAIRGACHHHASVGRRGGMCQPLSIPYARCRSHLSSCKLGNTSPVQLFNCEHQRGYTSSIPKAGALMSIGVNHVHHMSTGHTLYVEEVCANANGTYKLRVSHANYDRKCHLEEDAWVYYDPRAMHADFSTGHWAAWGKRLPVQGFILHEPVGRVARATSSSHTAETAVPTSGSPQARAQGQRPKGLRVNQQY